MGKPEKIEDGVVVTMQYELVVEDEIVDSSEPDEPIEFIQGAGHIIAGLERALYGMKIGEEKAVVVNPKDGYGDIDPEAIQEVQKSEFPDDIPLEIGIELELKDEEGEDLFARIVDVSKYTVSLDFNEPLAGKILNFKVMIEDLRDATQEELEHNHVHGDEMEE